MSQMSTLEQLQAEKARIEAQMASPEWQDAEGALCGAQMRWESVVCRIYELENLGMTLTINGNPVALPISN